MVHVDSTMLPLQTWLLPPLCATKAAAYLWLENKPSSCWQKSWASGLPYSRTPLGDWTGADSAYSSSCLDGRVKLLSLHVPCKDMSIYFPPSLLLYRWLLCRLDAASLASAQANLQGSSACPWARAAAGVGPSSAKAATELAHAIFSRVQPAWDCLKIYTAP